MLFEVSSKIRDKNVEHMSKNVPIKVIEVICFSSSNLKSKFFLFPTMKMQK